MSTCSGFSDSGDFSGKSSSEKTTSCFSQTCNKFAQYLKERGSLDELSLCMETTAGVMYTSNFLNNVGPADVNRLKAAAPVNFFPAHNHHYPMNIFPQQSVYAKGAVHMPPNSCISKPYVREPETAPMTIFYAGQVIVFNDVPADKAKEVMQLASLASSLSHKTVAPTLSMTQNGFAYGQNQVNSGYRTLPSSSSTPFMGMNMNQDHVRFRKEPIALPLARKNSLQRFMERRKERISARGPYFASRNEPVSSKQAAEGSWLSLAAQTS